MKKTGVTNLNLFRANACLLLYIMFHYCLSQYPINLIAVPRGKTYMDKKIQVAETLQNKASYFVKCEPSSST